MFLNSRYNNPATRPLSTPFERLFISYLIGDVCIGVSKRPQKLLVIDIYFPGLYILKPDEMAGLFAIVASTAD